MILSVYCKSCSSSNKLKSNASDRVMLSKEIGDSVLINCKNCSTEIKCDINQVTAERSKLNIIWALVTLIGTFIVVYFSLKYFDKGGVYSVYLLPVSIGIPSIIYFTWLKEEDKKIRIFNKYKK